MTAEHEPRDGRGRAGDVGVAGMRRRAGRLSAPKTWARPDIVLSSLSINVLGLALPITILQVYDRILPNAALDTLRILVFGLCGVVAVEALLRVGRACIVGWIGARFEHRTGREAFGRLIDADLQRFEADAPGVHLDRLQGLDQLREFYSGQAAIVLVDLPFALLFLGAIWFIAGWLLAVPLALLGVFAAASFWLARRMRRALERRNTLDDRRYNFLIEALGGMHTIKSMAMEPLMLRRYERLQEQSAQGIYEVGRLTSLSQSLGLSFSQLAMVATVAVGSIAVVDNRLTMGALAATTLLTGRALQPLLRVMDLWTQFQGIRLARGRLAEILSLPSSRPAAQPALGGAVAVENVAFRYGDRSPPLFDGLSLAVAPGETIGITGDNGVGKSTLLALMLGLVQPQGGRVLIDGRDIAELDPVGLRSQIAFMPQAATLFQGTLLDNLTLFRDGEAVDQAVDLVLALGLDDFITRLPRGLDTPLNEGTVEGLPNGIRQRIAMVRALVGDPRIVLFDDANAALDQQSDMRLRELLLRQKGKRTLILVSHRPSLLSLCDRCYRITGQVLQEVPVNAPPAPALPARPQLAYVTAG